MERLTRFLLRVRSLRQRLSQHHASLTVIPAVSSTSNRISETGRTEDLCASRLEQLPFEMRHQILLAVDTIEDLEALVHASPTYHQQYRLRRGFWLWRSLWLDMGPVLVDAHAANLSLPPSSQQERTSPKSQELLSDYHLRRSTTTEMLFDSSSTEEIICMASFYSSTVRPLVRQYVAWIRGNLGSLSVPDKLSKTEQTRIIRGMYRFQIYCNVLSQLHSGEGKTLRLFLAPYEPWEIEEILCIDRFATSKFQRVLEEVEQDLHPDNPRFGNGMRCYTPDGALEPAYWELFHNGLVRSGLPLLRATLKVQDHSKLVEWISENLVSREFQSMIEAIEHDGYERETPGQYADRDRAQHRRDKMPFIGDRDDSPPLAWVTIWRERYSNLFGRLIPDILRDWGYVMWDTRRLVDSGALVVFDKEWTEWNLNPDGEFEDLRDDDGVIVL